VGGKAKKEDGVKGYGLRVNHKEMKACKPKWVQLQKMIRRVSIINFKFFMLRDYFGNLMVGMHYVGPMLSMTIHK
jgi:hypothetical protein